MVIFSPVMIYMQSPKNHLKITLTHQHERSNKSTSNNRSNNNLSIIKNSKNRNTKNKNTINDNECG